jgi:hypothetical protein
LEIWAETLNFCPRKFHHLPREFWGPEIPPPGLEFPPPAVSLEKQGAGVKIPLGFFFHPDPLSPNRHCPLIKSLSGDFLATEIPGSRRPVLSSAWGFLSSTWFSPWMTVLSQISLPRCSCPSSRFVWADLFFH